MPTRDELFTKGFMDIEPALCDLRAAAAVVDILHTDLILEAAQAPDAPVRIDLPEREYRALCFAVCSLVNLINDTVDAYYTRYGVATSNAEKADV